MMAHRHAVDLAHHVGLEHRVAEVGGLDVLGDEVDLAGEVLLDDLLHPLHAVGELPVAGHHVHAQQLAGVDHVLRLGPQRGGRALPGVAAVEQQRAGAAGLQALDQRGQVREAADLAVAPRGLLEVEVGERMRHRRAGRHPGRLQQVLAHQVRQLALHGADAEVDARLAEVDRLAAARGSRSCAGSDTLPNRGSVVQRAAGGGGVGLGPAAQAHAGHAGGAPAPAGTRACSDS